MRLWRVSKYTDLSGAGGRLYPARWHSAGRPVVYTAEHSALALLESLVHLQDEAERAVYQLLELSAPHLLVTSRFEGDLPPDDQLASQTWGDQWLRDQPSALASVPSVIAPDARNILINPAHADAARIKLIRHARYKGDPRLFARA